MVGKGTETKTSRIFHQCYIKCCKMQNIMPLSNVIPLDNGKKVDFCVDRIKYADWPPIMNALSCDLSLHNLCIRCRQPVTTVLEQIDCERLAKTVNKRAVILTNFMLTNLIEAISQLLSNTSLLTTLLLEGLPMKIPYLNPLNEALLANNSLQHLLLGRCLVGDAGCIAVCRAVRSLPNILTLDLSGCDLTPLGATHIADLIKYQKIHRYSENWVHTLRYRLPDLDTMAGLRRITICANPQLGDSGASKLLEVLADDLWIKGIDLQNCGVSEVTVKTALHVLQSNTTLVVLDLRHNAEVTIDSLSKIRLALRDNEQGVTAQMNWLGNVSGCSTDWRPSKTNIAKSNNRKDRIPSNTRNVNIKHGVKTSGTKKERDYAEELEVQLREEISHRQQLEELNQQLVDQIKQLKEQMRMWSNDPRSSCSEQSLQASERSGDQSCSSGSTASVPIDQHTLSYIQQAFKDIYSFIKNNQCQGQCTADDDDVSPDIDEESIASPRARDVGEGRVNMVAKKAQSTLKFVENSMNAKKMTKSAHLLGETKHDAAARDTMKLAMIERHMGDSNYVYIEEHHGDSIKPEKHRINNGSPSSSPISDSSDTLVCSPTLTQRSLAPNPRDAFYSSEDESS